MAGEGTGHPPSKHNFSLPSLIFMLTFCLLVVARHIAYCFLLLANCM